MVIQRDGYDYVMFNRHEHNELIDNVVIINTIPFKKFTCKIISSDRLIVLTDNESDIILPYDLHKYLDDHNLYIKELCISLYHNAVLVEVFEKVRELNGLEF